MPSKPVASEGVLTFGLCAIITLLSLLLTLSCASPELLFDEADYATAALSNSWGHLWRGSDYRGHPHGPMMIYLAKLGYESLPGRVGSLETRLRFLNALVGALAVGLLYWALRHSFGTSRAAALVGSGLLLFSVIRLAETNLIGPHHLMLFCTIAVMGVGFRWRNTPTIQAGMALGAILGFGALSMTYVIPATLCWMLAVAAAGRGWIEVDQSKIGFSWSILVLMGTAVSLMLALWPPGVLQHKFLRDFLWYVRISGIATLIDHRFVENAPRSAFFYWLTHLEAPILVISACVIVSATLRAWKTNQLSSKHTYLGVFLFFFLATALSAPAAGARNLLQFLGVLSIVTGALFDNAVAHSPRLTWSVAAVTLILAALNLVWLWQNPNYKRFTAVTGYRAFLHENVNRANDDAKAIAFNTHALQLYSHEVGIPLRWDLNEMRWNIHSDAPPSDDVKYVLIPEFVSDCMPPEQPMRCVVAAQWRLVWSHKEGHLWELRLYENPRWTDPHRWGSR